MQHRNPYQRITRNLRGIWRQLTSAPNYSIIVFQMGKVGSKTVQASLIRAYKNLRQPVDVYHSHILTRFDESEEIIRRERPNPAPSLGAITNGRGLRRLIDESPQHQWKIISLVRDPVARNVATFFENIQEVIPDWQTPGYLNDPSAIQNVQQAFLDIKTIHSEPYRWFDEQMKPLFDVDVFASPFPHNAGYQIYNPQSRMSVMVIRLEDLNRIGSFAMKEFLRLDNFTLFNANIAEGKSYAELYRRFKQYPLPNKYLDEIYNTKYAHTFYTKNELEKFRDRWSKSGKI